MENSAEQSGREWFGVQLEVTQKLLKAENARLADLSDGQVTDFQRLAQTRLQNQSDELTREYQIAATDFLGGGAQSTRRSLPSLGFKGRPKSRTSLFSELVPPPSSESNDEEIPRWSPEPVFSEDGGLVTSQGRVLSGTPSALVDYFIPRSDFEPEASLCFTFVVLSRLFIAPHDLLMKLEQAASISIQADPSKSSRAALAQKYVGVLRAWADNCPYDFRDERTMLPLKGLTQTCSAQSSELKQVVTELQQSLFKTLNSLEKWEAKLKREYELQIRTKRETLSYGRTQKSLIEQCPDPAAAAQQLHFLEQERFGKIGPEEFVATFAGNSNERAAYSTPTYNIEAYVEWFNRLCSLVGTEILQRGTKKERTEMLEYFINIGIQCKERNNFNSLMAIIAAFNTSSVARLKKSWAKVNKKLKEQYKQLEVFMDPTSNFKRYRGLLKTIKEEQSVIPFFSLLVKDVYFANETMMSKYELPSFFISLKEIAYYVPRKENGHLNFEKYWMLSDLLASFVVQKQNKSKIERQDEVLRYLRSVPVCTEAELFKLSVEAEPPEKRNRAMTMERLRKISDGPADFEAGMTKSASSAAMLPDAAAVEDDDDEEGEFGFGG